MTYSTLNEANDNQSRITTIPSKETQPKKLLTDDSYNKIRSVQNTIQDETDMIPALRKIVNELITDENLKHVTDKLIQDYQ